MDNNRFLNLIHFFKSYHYNYDVQDQLHQNESSNTYSSKKWQLLIEQAIANGKTLIGLFDQKVMQLSSQNELLQQQIDHLKYVSNEQKKQTDRLLQSSKEIIEELRKELIDRDWQNRALMEKIQSIQAVQIQQINFYNKSQHENALILHQKSQVELNNYQRVINQLEQEITHNLQKIKSLQQGTFQMELKVEELQSENSKLNCLLQHYLTQLNGDQQQIIEEDTSQVQDYETNSEKESHREHPIKFQLFHNQQGELEHLQRRNSEDDILNSSYEGSVMKETLNISDYHESRFNMTKELLRTKQKQNINQNFLAVNNTNSYKKTTVCEGKDGFLSKHSSQKLVRIIRDVKEFTMSDQQQTVLDPYFMFFTLTAQCVKINSKHFEQIAEIDIVDKEWKYVIRNRVPMNLWGHHIERQLLKATKIQNKQN